MSERKVLNKYYPPDFDPSKIPRSKVGRNKTFTIRLMAPCNMRCTTCGEYIYKGRKFNARKEDVDDMNHLGLRIYRFYIRCTACLSEISFRTDPENTDYVLEAGATRNFEALAKAEKQAELEERAYQEELKTNPMKLLEERTEASKNEMERMEALEELQELNRRQVRLDLDTVLLAAASADGRKKPAQPEEDLPEDLQEKADEEFVRKAFGYVVSPQDGGEAARIKRISADPDRDDDDEDVWQTLRKRSKKLDSAETLVSSDKKRPMPSASTSKKNAWEKSIGSMSSSGGGTSKLGILVKKKSDQTLPASTASPSAAPCSSNVSIGTSRGHHGSDPGEGCGNGTKDLDQRDNSKGQQPLLNLVGDYGGDSSGESSS